MEVLQPSTGLQTCSTYTTLHDTTVAKFADVVRGCYTVLMLMF